MAEPKNDRVEIFIPRAANNDDPNLFVSVNGQNFLLPRGKKSKVPKHVAQEIQRSWAAEDTQNDNIAEMLAAAQQ